MHHFLITIYRHHQRCTLYIVMINPEPLSASISTTQPLAERDRPTALLPQLIALKHSLRFQD
ncbi:hypothetical protein MH117_23020 [Paenibacillus sp. ACRRX]|nr:hypothetical protein [Paenibacillus sp. ACRRX]